MRPFLRWPVKFCNFAMVAVLGILASDLFAQDRYTQHRSSQRAEAVVFHVTASELPAEKFEAITRGWLVSGSSRSMVAQGTSLRMGSRVVPASHEAKRRDYEIRTASSLSSEQVEWLLKQSKNLSTPKITGQDGNSAKIKIGVEREFVTAYEPVLDEDDKPTQRVKPKISRVNEGLELALDCTLTSDPSALRVGVNLQLKSVEGVEKFTIDSNDGPLTLEHPRVKRAGLQTSCTTERDRTLAICCGPETRRRTVQRPVPIVGKVPYLNRLFKNSAIATEDYYHLILIHCESVSQSTGPN